MQVKAIDSTSESYQPERPLECGNTAQNAVISGYINDPESGSRPRYGASTFREGIYIIDRAREGWPSPRVVNQLRGFWMARVIRVGV